MKYYNRLADSIEKVGTNPSALSTELKMGNATISRWKDGDPYFSSITTVAEYLGVSLDYLAGISNNPNYDKMEYKSSTYEVIKLVESMDLTTPQVNMLKKLISDWHSAITTYDDEKQAIDEMH